jgi:hypothetical protein
MASVEREAQAFAVERGKLAITLKEQLGIVDYVWVQFVDGKVEPGQRCPRCGSEALRRVQQYFARCISCDSLHALSGRPAGPHPSEVGEIIALRLLSPDGKQLLPRPGDTVPQVDELGLGSQPPWNGDEVADQEDFRTNVKWTIGLVPDDGDRQGL